VARRRIPRSTSLDLTQFTASSPWPNLEAFIAEGGNISLGRIAPIECAAVASDEYSMLAALVRRKEESFMDLMQRLDAAIAKALKAGEPTDEINVRQPSRR
jgi:hypothetical protein